MRLLIALSLTLAACGGKDTDTDTDTDADTGTDTDDCVPVDWFAETWDGVDADCDGLSDDEELMVALPAGSFTMGSPEDEVGRFDGETLHEVTLSRGFLLGIHEVTQAQFEALMGYQPSNFSCEDCPVEQLTWSEAAAFANAASEASGLESCYTCTGEGSDTECAAAKDPYACGGYRLPTEAEWEYAARAGTSGAFGEASLVSGTGNQCDGALALDDGSLLDDQAWYCGDAEDKTHTVGALEPNGAGLYDVHGNVAEWCHDWHADYDGDATDPSGPAEGTVHIRRGASYGDVPRTLRAAFRGRLDGSHKSTGFRLARSAE